MVRKVTQHCVSERFPFAHKSNHHSIQGTLKQISLSSRHSGHHKQFIGSTEIQNKDQAYLMNCKFSQGPHSHQPVNTSLEMFKEVAILTGIQKQLRNLYSSKHHSVRANSTTLRHSGAH